MSLPISAEKKDELTSSCAGLSEEQIELDESELPAEQNDDIMAFDTIQEKWDALRRQYPDEGLYAYDFHPAGGVVNRGGGFWIRLMNRFFGTPIDTFEDPPPQPLIIKKYVRSEH